MFFFLVLGNNIIKLLLSNQGATTAKSSQKPNPNTIETPASKNNENMDSVDGFGGAGFDMDADDEINLDDNDDEFQKFLNSDLIDDRLVLVVVIINLFLFCFFSLL